MTITLPSLTPLSARIYNRRRHIALRLLPKIQFSASKVTSKASTFMWRRPRVGALISYRSAAAMW